MPPLPFLPKRDSITPDGKSAVSMSQSPHVPGDHTVAMKLRGQSQVLLPESDWDFCNWCQHLPLAAQSLELPWPPPLGEN